MPPFSRKQKAARKLLRDCPKCNGLGYIPKGTFNFRCTGSYFMKSERHRHEMSEINRDGCRVCKGTGKMTDAAIAEYVVALMLK